MLGRFNKHYEDDILHVPFPIKYRQSHHDEEFGMNPQLRDPYESKMVEVQSSEIEGASEGLFALKDIEINTVVAFYNGTKPDPEDYDPDTWETNNYKIFDPADMPDGTIDIPVWAQVLEETNDIGPETFFF